MEFDLIVGEEELLQRQDDAEAEQKVQRDQTHFLEFVLYRWEPIHRESSSLCFEGVGVDTMVFAETSNSFSER